MFKNYLKVAFRNLWRHKVYSFINLFGLSIGIALAVLVLLFIRDELSYDSFHERPDRIYRIAQIENHNGELVSYMRIGPAITTRMLTDFPESVETAVRLLGVGEVWTKFGDKLFRETRLFIVDETFFDVFSFPFITGDAASSLKEPNSLVLNRTTAEKYFGTTDAVGQMVRVDIPGSPLLKVTGVIEDAPGNSHFHPDLIIPFSTIRNEQNAPLFDQFFGNFCWGYIVLKENHPPGPLEAQFPAFLGRHLDENLKNRLIRLYLQPLKDLHLRSSTDPFTEIEPENTGNISYIYIFSIIAFLVLVIACINFMNMATARSANRAREVGMRKVVGATRRGLRGQFVGESIFISLLSLPLALAMGWLFLPVFNRLTGKAFSAGDFGHPVLLLGSVLIVLFVGLLSGSYPAFFLSSFRPVDVLRGRTRSGGRSGFLRKILVVGQFAVSIGFVIGVLIILQQMKFMRQTDLGFDKENVVVVPVLLPEQPAQVQGGKIEVLKNEYSRHPGVISVAAASGAPSDIRNIVLGRKEGDSPNDSRQMVEVAVDDDFIKTLQIQIIQGRDFSKDFTTDVGGAFVVNEAVVRELNLTEPIGSRMYLDDRQGTIIGVMKSPHWEPKRRVIFPMVFHWQPQELSRLIIRLDSRDVPGTMAFLETKWKENVTTRPFQSQFLSDMIDNLYKSERRLTDVVINFALLTVFIACLGLFGLASFTAEQRTKEVGIRKVLGASAPGIVLLLARQFGKLILVANLIAWPAAYYVLGKWLRGFAYRIGIDAWPFFQSALLVAAVALVSVITQSVRAALANPVDSLKYE